VTGVRQRRRKWTLMQVLGKGGGRRRRRRRHSLPQRATQMEARQRLHRWRHVRRHAPADYPDASRLTVFSVGETNEEEDTYMKADSFSGRGDK